MEKLKQRVQNLQKPKAKVEVMQNKLILKLIVRKMLATDLKSLRTTCTVWNQAFIPGLRDKQGKRHLYCCDEQPKSPTASRFFLYLVTPDGTESKNMLERITNVMRGSKEVPVAKFHLDDVHAAGQQKITHFFRVCGAFITHLDMQFSTLGRLGIKDSPIDIEKFKRIIFEHAPNLVDLSLEFYGEQSVLDNLSVSGVDQAALALPLHDLPNLRRLKFCVFPDEEAFRGQEWAPSYRNILADLFRHAIGLKSLSLVSSEPGKTVNNIEVLSILRDHMSPQRLSELGTLEISSPDVGDMQMLLDLAGCDAVRVVNPLRLKELLVAVNYNNPRYEEILALLSRFLSSQSDTLRHLSLSVNFSFEFEQKEKASEPAYPINLPTMPGLRSLLIKQELNSRRNAECCLAEHIKLTYPGLVKFEYHVTLNELSYLDDEFDYGNDEDEVDGPRYGDCEAGVNEGMGQFGHHGVTDLSLHTKYVGSKDFFQTYGQRFAFESLIRLEIRLEVSGCVEMFAQICTAMPALEVLHIVFKAIEGDPDQDSWRESTVELDEILTGVPKNMLGKLERAIKLNSKGLQSINLDSLQTWLEKHKQKPALGSLCRLKKFAVTASTSRRYKLTDIGGYFGLALASPTLQEIIFDTIGPISENARTENNAGNLVSVQCKEMIRSAMSPPAVLCFY